jgi:hypothetical protein
LQQDGIAHPPERLAGRNRHFNELPEFSDIDGKKMSTTERRSLC